MDLQLITLAYKYVAAMAMLNEAADCSNQLGLPASGDVTKFEVVDVAPPRLMGFAGTVRGNGFVFNFLGDGRLRFITRVGRFPKLPLAELHQQLAGMSS